MVSDIVLSLAGRDKGMHFIVLREEGQWLWLANGKARRAECPKRKKRKHTVQLGRCDDWTCSRIQETGRLSNSEIRKALAAWQGAGSVPDSN